MRAFIDWGFAASVGLFGAVMAYGSAQVLLPMENGYRQLNPVAALFMGWGAMMALWAARKAWRKLRK
ncbi:MAG: hypothetical protein M0002_03320 [Rhodospirillales bacterium]|nr:hypothetical protein [Rhodospirillales bacterium]